MSSLVYLAQPIDVPTAESITAYEQVLEYLRSEPVWTYDPLAAFRANRAAPDPRAQVINQVALANCDAVLALLPAASSSVGVPIEIKLAADAGKPVFVWRDSPSWFLASLPSVSVFDDLVSAIQALLEFLTPTESYGEAEDDDPGHDAEFECDDPECEDCALAVPETFLPDLPLPCVPVFAGTGAAPSRAHPDDVGYDLFSAANVVIPVGEYGKVPYEVAVEWPPGHWGMLVGRSSAFDRGLLVNTGIIDPGYRGELFAIVRNIGHKTVTVAPGQRIAQLIPMPTVADSWGLGMERVHHLSETTRGTNGFGSTGS